MSSVDKKSYKIKNGSVISIRTAQAKDAEKIINIKKSIVLEDTFMLRDIDEAIYTLESEKKDIENHFKKNGSLYIVAETENRVIGFLEFENGEFKKTSHAGMFTIFLLKQWREMGIGNLLLNTLIEWAKENPLIEKITLAVFSTNERAQYLYRKFGFIEEGRCPKDMKLKDGTYMDSILMYKFVM